MGLIVVHNIMTNVVNFVSHCVIKITVDDDDINYFAKRKRNV